MTAYTSPTPQRVRIHSHITRSRFLHVEDALEIGKLRLFAGSYRQEGSMGDHAHAFVDVADARVLFGALAAGEQGFRHREYKSTPPRGSRGAMSRMLSIAVKGEKVSVELKSGPGKMTPTGVITLKGLTAVVVRANLTLYEARRLGAAVLAYLRAWDVVRMTIHRRVVGRPGCYELVPGASPAAATETAFAYGDGQAVDADNLTEMETFRRYVTEQHALPGSKADLLAYLRERTQVTAA